MPASNVNKTAEALKIGAALKLAKRVGYITDALVAAATGLADLWGDVQALSVKKNSSELDRAAIVTAIKRGGSLGLFTDGNITPLTTADGLIALTGAAAGASGAWPYL